MSAHAKQVAENLFELTARKLRPLIIAVDNHNAYVSHQGELSDYQLPEFAEGQSCVESMPFLVGLESESYVSLPIVKFNEDNICSVSVIKINIYRYVVMLKVGEEYEREQEATQESNETKLLYQRLQVLTQQLEIANSAKSRFISAMSHEFRTPMSSIMGYSNLLANKFDSNDEESKYAKAIENNAQYLLSLIDNVLEHAQLEADKLMVSLAPFAIDDIITNLENMFRVQATNANLAFTVDKDETVPAVICSDQLRLQQILINLVGNAFKFTDAGSVNVKFYWQNDELQVAVSDTGRGIPQEHQASIFQAYNRYEAEDKKGAGLGLAISAQIAEKLKGSLELVSQVGQGSVFTLRVEAQKASLPTAVDSSSSVAVEIKTILIVEDDADLMALLKIYLQDMGYETISAIDGNEALQKCESEAVDLVLLDMQLPKLNGTQVAKMLRSRNFQTPIIAMTASSNIEDKESALVSGCNHFLSKPIQQSSLNNAINMVSHVDV